MFVLRQENKLGGISKKMRIKYPPLAFGAFFEIIDSPWMHEFRREQPEESVFDSVGFSSKFSIL